MNLQHLSSQKNIILFTALIIIHLALANIRLLGPSTDNHFAYLAQSFVHGTSEMLVKPPHQNDWASYEILELKNGDTIKGFWMIGKNNLFRKLSGEEITLSKQDVKRSEQKYFVSFPPFPAILMIPLYLLFGLNASDTWLTLICSVLNSYFLWHILQYLRQKGIYQRPQEEDYWIIALFSLGTAHLWCGIMGKVWFTALIVGVSCQLLFIRFAIGMRSPLIAGIALGCAFATRTTLVLSALFFYAQIFFPLDDNYDFKERIRRSVLFSIPCLVIGLGLLYFNHIRFENPFEFGHTYLFGGNMQRIRDYGLFHPVFFHKNLVAAFLLLPKIISYSPYLLISYHGMAIQFSSPALLWIFAQKKQDVFQQRLQAILLSNAFLALLLILFYQNTGWIQYSFRFILDILPMLMLSIACLNRKMGLLFKSAVIWGIVINLFGAITFQKSVFQMIFVDLPLLLPH